MAAPIVIVGAGEAGVAAAEALRDHGYQGEIVLLSAEHQLPYERPPLSKEVLLGDAPAPPPIRPEGWYAERGVDLRLGIRVADIDPVTRGLTLEAGGRESPLSYSKLLLATGTRARRFPKSGGLLYLRSGADGARIKQGLAEARRVAVIGGGVIGLEIASAAIKLGKRVQVIEVAPRLMPRVFTPCASQVLETLHREAGVDLRLGVGAVEVGDDGIAVDGAPLEADLFVGGIGALPNTELGERAGCVIENGIRVDGQGRTSVPDIYAAGDVASFPHPLVDRLVRIETWQHAQRHGAHAARAMLGDGTAYAEVPWFWTDQHGVNVQVAGFAGAADDTVWRGSPDVLKRTGLHFSDGRLIAATTVDNGRDMRPAINLIAARWRGDSAVLTDPDRGFGPIAKACLREQKAA